MQDWQLLRDYLDNNSESAFTELLNRHLGLVYSAVLRRVNDRHAAQDVTQSVFCLLVQKARQLSKDTVIVGWLYRTACLKASEYIRSENRRQHRERSMIMTHDAATASDDDWERTAPHLEEAMSLLDEQDRLAVLLRFFKREPLKEVGRVLGISEDAARMRVNRALDRLRRQLAHKGIHCAGATLGIMLSERAVEAASAEVFQLIRTAVFATSQVATAASPVPLFVGANLKTLIAAGVVIMSIATAVLYWRHHGGILPGPSEKPTPVEVLTAVSTRQAGRLAPLRRSPDNLLISPAGPALERLRQLLYSSVADLVYPTTDLEQAIKELNEHPDETIALLSEALNSDLKEPRWRAACAFGLLGPGAIEALPQLIEKARSDPELAQLLFPSAVRISPQTQLLAELIEIYRSASPDDQFTFLSAASTAIGNLADHHPDLAPEIRAVLVAHLTDADVELRKTAALKLAYLPGEKDPAAIPELATALDSLHDWDAIQALKQYGPAAKAAIPAIERFRAKATDPRLQELAIETLAAIAPEMGQRQTEIAQQLEQRQQEELLKERIQSGQASIEDLIAGLDSSWAVRGQVLAALKKLGPQATIALPSLLHQFEHGQREDGLARQLISDTIRAIDPGTPKLWFSRDELMPVLRAVADSSTRSEAHGEHLFSFQRNKNLPMYGYDQSELRALVSELQDTDPSLRDVFITKLREIDEPTADSLDQMPKKTSAGR